VTGTYLSPDSGRAKPDDKLLPDFADLIVGMSRLLIGLAAMEPFRNADFSMADWVALSVLAKGPAKNNRQLAKMLGVTRQRANQIKTSLEKARLISATQSSKDARQNVIEVTSRGQAQLENLNSQISSLLASSLKSRERALARTNRSIKILTRIVRAGKETGMKPARKKMARRKMASRASRAGTGT
jgi:DNA-binding MarR family transcriptional regulator